jgi:hypothetical protein
MTWSAAMLLVMLTTASMALGTALGLQLVPVPQLWFALVVVLIQLLCAWATPATARLIAMAMHGAWTRLAQRRVVIRPHEADALARSQENLFMTCPPVTVKPFEVAEQFPEVLGVTRIPEPACDRMLLETFGSCKRMAGAEKRHGVGRAHPFRNGARDPWVARVATEIRRMG